MVDSRQSGLKIYGSQIRICLLHNLGPMAFYVPSSARPTSTGVSVLTQICQTSFLGVREEIEYVMHERNRNDIVN